MLWFEEKFTEQCILEIKASAIQWSPFTVITMEHYIFDNNNQMIIVTESDGNLTGTST